MGGGIPITFHWVYHAGHCAGRRDSVSLWGTYQHTQWPRCQLYQCSHPTPMFTTGNRPHSTTAYHPQGNGQVERFNCTLEAMLAKVVQTNQRDSGCSPAQGPLCLPYCSTRGHVVHTIPPSLWPFPHVTSGCNVGPSKPSSVEEPTYLPRQQRIRCPPERYGNPVAHWLAGTQELRGE